MLIVVCLVVVAGLGLALPPMLSPLLARLGVIDVPNERSSHTHPAIRGVGLAPILAVVAGYLFLLVGSEGPDVGGQFLALLVVPVLAGVLGGIEDFLGVPVVFRAGAQVAIGVAGASLICAMTELPLWFIPVFAFSIAGYINVANFMDGINGISGLHGVIVGAAYAVVGALTGEAWMVPAGLFLAIAFMGFLPWNLIRGGMFLGDVGSYFLGGSIAMIASLAIARGVSWIVVLGPLVIYLVDSGVTLVKRVASGDRWFEAHRSHVYQQLTTTGRSHCQVSTVVAVFSVLATSAGLLALTGPIGVAVSIAVIVLVAGVYLLLPLVVNRDLYETVELPESNLPKGAVVGGPLRWVVIGGSGFIGSAVAHTLEAGGAEVIQVKAPRFHAEDYGSAEDIVTRLGSLAPEVELLADLLEGADVVVNAAGLASPDAADAGPLFGANSLLPVVVFASAAKVGAKRVIHLSSAAVQGRTPRLEEVATYRVFSAYSRSKALGEKSLFAHLSRTAPGAGPELVVVRATSVQGKQRETTIKLRRVAASWLSSVAAPGNQPTVVSSVVGLARFIRFIGMQADSVPTVVLQPWEGLTTAEVLRAAGGREPKLLPAGLCRFLVSAGYLFGIVLKPLQGAVRRVELMWFGQEQNASWALQSNYEGGAFLADVLRPPLEGQS